MKKVVCIGGGLGASQILLGLSKYDLELTGLIAVTDSGRSTGKVRIAADIPAPGDIRNALVNLSQADPFLKELFQFRFKSPKMTELDGMAFGNLFIAALSQMLGSFEKAVDKTSDFLQVKGKVIPIMLANTHIACEREDGTFDYEDVNVRSVGKSPIKRLFLQDDDTVANPQALAAIAEADMITIGPGSLYTTVVACLLTPGVPEALSNSNAKIVAVINTTQQPGQTEGYTLAKHLQILQSYLPTNTIDYCFVNTGTPNQEKKAALEQEGLQYMEYQLEEATNLKNLGVEIITADLIEAGAANPNLWNKQDTIRHDPNKIARVLNKLLD